MNPQNPHKAILLVFLFLFVAVASLTSVDAAAPTVPDRESSYPDGVQNITQKPWTPQRGETVTVTATLHDDAPRPSNAHLLYCRVEPQYVCAAPKAMDASEDRRVWTATIPWDRFMHDETEHVGYNVTFRFADPSADSGVRRVAAPTGNHWVPDTYPEASDGTYYFLTYSGSVEDSPAPVVGFVVLALVVIVLAGRREAVRRG